MSALGLGLIAAACWGFHDICVRFVSQKTPLMASLLAVSIVGLVFHLIMMTVEDAFVALPVQATGLAVASGGFFLLASLGLYAAFQRGPVRLVAPIIASFPVLSVAWAVIQGSSITLPQVVAVLAIVAGVSVVAALAHDDASDIPPKGRTIAYAALSSVGFAGTFALGQQAAALSHDMPVTLVTRSTALVVLIALMWFQGLRFWPGRSALPVLTMMGIADGIALICVVSAGGLPNAEYASVTSSVFGLLTILMAWMFLKERMTAPQWIGCAVTFAGIGYLAL